MREFLSKSFVASVFLINVLLYPSPPGMEQREKALVHNQKVFEIGLSFSLTRCGSYYLRPTLVSN